MDFGWKKADPIDDDANAVASNPGAQTTELAPSPDSTTIPAATEDHKNETADSLVVPSNIAADADEKVADLSMPDKSDDFEMSKKDDSFGNEFTMDAAAASQPDDNPEPTGDSLSSPMPKESDYSDPLIPAIEETDSPEIPAVDPEKAEPETSPKEEELPTITAESSSDSSLTDLEKKIADSKEETDKQLSELQEKVTKLDDLLTKIKKMKDDEQSLIEEISSSI